MRHIAWRRAAAAHKAGPVWPCPDVQVGYRPVFDVGRPAREMPSTPVSSCRSSSRSSFWPLRKLRLASDHPPRTTSDCLFLSNFHGQLITRPCEIPGRSDRAQCSERSQASSTRRRYRAMSGRMVEMVGLMLVDPFCARRRGSSLCRLALAVTPIASASVREKFCCVYSLHGNILFCSDRCLPDGGSPSLIPAIHLVMILRIERPPSPRHPQRGWHRWRPSALEDYVFDSACYHHLFT